jgi:hypothetical protein
MTRVGCVSDQKSSLMNEIEQHSALFKGWGVPHKEFVQLEVHLLALW